MPTDDDPRPPWCARGTCQVALYGVLVGLVGTVVISLLNSWIRGESIDLTNCPQLSFPPSHVQDKPVKHIVAFLRAAHLLTQNKDKDGLDERMKEFSEDKHEASVRLSIRMRL